MAFRNKHEMRREFRIAEQRPDTLDDVAEVEIEGLILYFHLAPDETRTC